MRDIGNLFSHFNMAMRDVPLLKPVMVYFTTPWTFQTLWYEIC